MEQQDSKSGYYSAMLFLVWPFLALVSAFRNYRNSWAKNILWAFVAFYGLSFAIGAESQGNDIVRYAAEVEQLHTQQMTTEGAWDYYRQSEEIDILATLIAVIVSRVTDNQTVVTLVYGIIFGFFFSRNMWFVLEHFKGKIRPITILLFSCFFLIIPIWNINGFRMWTAAHIFIYGLLPFLFEGRKKGLIIATLSILVHYSFIIPVAVLYTYILFGNWLTVYFIFFIATFFIAEINLEAFNNLVEGYAPEMIQEQTSGYRGEEYVESYREGDGPGKVWYAVWYGKALTWSVVGFLVMLFVRGREFFTANKKWLGVFCFTLLFYGVANLFSSLPSGARFITVANAIALALIILYIQNKEKETLVRQSLVTVPLLLLFIVVSVRMALYSLSASAVFGNPFISLFFNEGQISLNDVMRMII